MNTTKRSGRTCSRYSKTCALPLRTDKVLSMLFREAPILTPGFGYSITPVSKFPDRPGRENRVHFSYARDKTTDQAAPDCPRGTQCLNVRIAAAIGEPGPAKRAVATGCSTPSVLNARQRTLSQSLHGIDKADNGSVEAAS